MKVCCPRCAATSVSVVVHTMYSLENGEWKIATDGPEENVTDDSCTVCKHCGLSAPFHVFEPKPQKDVKFLGDDTRYVEWQPGNGFRYMLFFTKLSDEVCAATGAVSGSWMVVRMNAAPYPTMVVAPTGVLHWKYVEDKMKCTQMDASEITRMVGEIVGRDVELCTDDSGMLPDKY